MFLSTFEHPQLEEACFQFKKTLREGAPLSLRGVVMAIQLFSKRYILAQNSAQSSAIYADLGALENLILYFNFSTLAVLSPMIKAAQTINPDDLQSMRSIFTHGVLLAGILSAMTTVICIAAPTLYRITHQPEDTLAASRIYFLLSISSYIPDLFYRLHVRTQIGFDDFKTPLIFDTLEASLDVVLTYLLVQKPLNMGVNGCAIAYSLSAIATCGAYHVYLRQRSDFIKLRPYFSYQDISKKDFLILLKHGLNTGCTEASNYLALVFATLLCGLSGPSALIGMQAAGMVSFAINLPLDGLGSAISVLMSEYWTKKNPLFRLIASISLMVGFSYACLSFITLYFGSDKLAGLFIPDHEVLNLDRALIARFIWIQALIEIANTLSALSSSILIGCLETRLFIPLNITCILGMNTLATVATHLTFPTLPDRAYASQLLGYVSRAVGLLYLCQRKVLAQPIAEKPQEEETSNAYNRYQFWNRPHPCESPLHPEIFELLPMASESVID